MPTTSSEAFNTWLEAIKNSQFYDGQESCAVPFEAWRHFTIDAFNKPSEQEEPVQNLAEAKTSYHDNINTAPEEAISPRKQIDLSQQSLNALRQLQNTCELCQKQVPYIEEEFGLNENAKIMIVTESQGLNDNYYQSAFYGDEGSLLIRILRAMEIDPKEIYIAQIHRCKESLRQNVTLNDSNRELIKTQIQRIQPQYLLVMSPIALQCLFDESYTIREHRGQWLEYQGTPLMSTLPLWYILREKAKTEDFKRELWSHLKKFLAVAENKK